MSKYNVTITETLLLSVPIEADSKEEAENIINDAWYNGEYILDDRNFIGVNFKKGYGGIIMFYKVLFILACVELVKRVRSFINESIVVNNGSTELRTGAFVSIGLSVLFYIMVLAICFMPSMIFGWR